MSEDKKVLSETKNEKHQIISIPWTSLPLVSVVLEVLS